MGAMFPVRKSDAAAGLLLIIGLLLGSACVSETIEPADIPRVSTSQNSKGLVTLSWASKKGYAYRLMIRDMSTGEWSPVPGSGVFYGTGDIITVQDHQNPNKPLPWYSVRPEKIAQ